jgi:hypothetical protein
VKDETVRRLDALGQPRSRQRVLVVASAPAHCVICQGSRRVDIGGATGPCPHCQLGLPIAHLPMRVDIPRSESA